MNNICLIIPYFGKFPNYFQLWLNSVKYNPDIAFLIFTDDDTDYDYPSNVTVVKTTFDSIRKRIKNKYNFRVPLKSPYKLCDFKVAYGDIFQKELEEYNYWGYCDVDLIFGNIKKFITDDILEEYEKINIHGHLSIYKNNEKMRVLYKRKYKDLVNYKNAFSTNWIYHFDEYPGMAYIAQRAKVKMIDIEDYADIDRFSYKFLKVYDHSEKENDSNEIVQIFKWNRGVLTNIIKDNQQLVEYEMMYIHLQKRQMSNNLINIDNGYYIVPNQFVKIDNSIISCMEEYVYDEEYDELKRFKKECLKQKTGIDYWRMKTVIWKKKLFSRR